MPSKLSRDEERRERIERWKGRIKEWKSSSLTQSEYCRYHNLSYHKFRYWKKQLTPAAAVTKFVPIDIGSNTDIPVSSAGNFLRLELTGGFKIEIYPGFDPRLLQQLIISPRGVQ
ncbi:MAG: hypothetical protein JRK26_27195 [Deltaproteobacteria bacterium]|nr:hypothetical protein [Deltaproteobacteria bacterium]